MQNHEGDIEQLLEQVKWNEAGLVACIAQCSRSQRVLMMAWMNRESLRLTIERQHMVYWSRSRQQLWQKGESSGHLQKLHSLQLDCDGDCLLASVEQIGDIACHTGTNSCFYRELKNGDWTRIEEPLKSAASIYSDDAKPE